MPKAYEQLLHRLHDVNALEKAITIMDWDQQTYLPHGGGEARAEHVGVLSRMAHELFVADEVGVWLQRAATEVDPNSDEGAIVRVTQRDYDLRTKIPVALVAEKSRLAAEAHEKWVAARANNDFASFQPYLEKMFDFARQEAEYLGYTDHIYDALLDQFEEGATAADCRAMFATLKENTVDLVREISTRGKPVDDRVLYGEWDHAAQRSFAEMLLRDIGFDMNRGRLDVAAHPFCTNFSVNDVRLTTRFIDHICSSIMSTMHEAGHGMYEQGSPSAWDRTPIAGGVSLGVHESQSRLWENIIGRSRAFWTTYLPDLQAAFPRLAGVSVNDFYRMVNKVEPSFIRVEADEVTYNLHVMIRFELECEILTGALAVRDLPEAWNAKVKDYLGLDVPADGKGCLQDVHWSGGAIGYFPTYTMGNLLSYQIWRTLQRDVPDTDELIAQRQFAPILGWLQEKVYSQGSKFPPKDLVLRVTGKPMAADDYAAGLRAKYTEIYEL